MFMPVVVIMTMVMVLILMVLVLSMLVFVIVFHKILQYFMIKIRALRSAEIFLIFKNDDTISHSYYAENHLCWICITIMCMDKLQFTQTPNRALSMKPISPDRSPNGRAHPHPIIFRPAQWRASQPHHRGWESGRRWDGYALR